MSAWQNLKAELKSMAREAAKDIRQTINEAYFGRPEHAAEPGTPLNPTAYEITAERGNVHGGLAERIEQRAGNSRPDQTQEMER